MRLEHLVGDLLRVNGVPLHAVEEVLQPEQETRSVDSSAMRPRRRCRSDEDPGVSCIEDSGDQHERPVGHGVIYVTDPQWPS